MDFNSLCEDARAKSYILEELSKIGKAKKVFFLFSSLFLSYLNCYIWSICVYDKISHQFKVVLYNYRDSLKFTYTVYFSNIRK